MAAVENQQPQIDPETLARVAREVIARLTATAVMQAPANLGPNQPSARPVDSSPDNNSDQSVPSKNDCCTASIADRVITCDTIVRLPKNTAEVHILDAAVVTPSARDEAQIRRITIRRGQQSNQATPTTTNEKNRPSAAEIIDFANPDRAAAVAQQLSRRSIAVNGRKIILSDTPARELYHQCTRHGEIAVMVGSLEEVQRFANEIDATVWVLDMKRLNMMAAVNVAARIARTAKADQ